MNRCTVQHRQVYFAFLEVTQTFDWEQAAALQLQASALSDAIMDAFMDVCRAQEAGIKQERDCA